MIITVTPNPAIDRTVVLDELKRGQINRAKRSLTNLGGKGINVAKDIAALRGETKCLGFLGEKDNFALEYLKNLGIQSDFTLIKNRIRTNTKLIEEGTSVYTDINEPGPEISPEEEKNLFEKIKLWAPKAGVMVLAGSLPAGIVSDFYKRVILETKATRIKVILDAEKDALNHGMEAGPYMIKPNIDELSGVVNKKLESFEDIIHESLNLIQKGIHIVAVSMGSRGSLTVTSKKAYLVPPMDIKVKNTVGAGDAMVAGFALALDRGLDVKEAVRMAAAASSASITREGTVPLAISTFEDLLPKVKITEISLEER